MGKLESSLELTLPTTITERHVQKLSEMSGVHDYKIAYVLSHVFSHQEARTNYWVECNAMFLRKMVTSGNASKILNLLVEAEVFECNGSYHPGEASKCYRFNEQYRTIDEWQREVKKKTFIKSYQRHVLKRIDLNNDALDWQRKSLTRLSLDGDVDHSLEKIVQSEQYRKEYEASGTGLNFHNWKTKKVYSWKRPLKQIGDANAKASGRVLRVSTPVTNIKSEARRHLLIDGEETTEIDISNCQPLVLLSLFKNGVEASDLRAIAKTTVENAKEFKMLKAKIRDSVMSVCGGGDGGGAGDGASYCCPKQPLLGGPIQNRQHCSRLHRAALKGEFYEALQDLLSIKTRARAKQVFNNIVFSEPHRLINNPKVKQFAQLCPELWNWTKEVRSDFYKDLSYALQKIEAFVVAYATPHVLKKRNVPVLTVHDSIIVKTDHVEIGHLAIKKAFNTVLGVEPTVKTEGDEETQTEELQRLRRENEWMQAEMARAREERAELKQRLDQIEEDRDALTGLDQFAQHHLN